MASQEIFFVLNEYYCYVFSIDHFHNTSIVAWNREETERRNAKELSKMWREKCLQNATESFMLVRSFKTTCGGEQLIKNVK
jgi:hypothetical protein